MCCAMLGKPGLVALLRVLRAIWERACVLTAAKPLKSPRRPRELWDASQRRPLEAPSRVRRVPGSRETINYTLC